MKDELARGSNLCYRRMCDVTKIDFIDVLTPGFMNVKPISKAAGTVGGYSGTTNVVTNDYDQQSQ